MSVRGLGLWFQLRVWPIVYQEKSQYRGYGKNQDFLTFLVPMCVCVYVCVCYAPCKRNSSETRHGAYVIQGYTDSPWAVVMYNGFCQRMSCILGPEGPKTPEMKNVITHVGQSHVNNFFWEVVNPKSSKVNQGLKTCFLRIV